MTNLADKRRAVLLQVSNFLRTANVAGAADGVTALELAALTAKLSLPDNGAAQIREPMSEDVCVTRGGVSVIAPASTPESVLLALFNLAKSFGQTEMTLADIVDAVRVAVNSNPSQPTPGGYRDHSVVLAQVDAMLRGELCTSDPFPDGADVYDVTRRVSVVCEAFRAATTALGPLVGLPRTVDSTTGDA